MRDKLQNKARRQYDYVSRYALVSEYINETTGADTQGLPVPLSSDTPYIGYFVKDGDSYDSLALAFYNNPTFYWVIMSFNGVEDPFDFPEPGHLLQIPVLAGIEFKTQGLR